MGGQRCISPSLRIGRPPPLTRHPHTDRLFPQLDNETHQVPIVPGPASHAIGNLIDDWQAGRIDWVVHSGDHAYEFEVEDGQRGDGYMDAYSALLAHVPFVPGWGNQ